MLAHEIIEASTSDWASLIVLVGKKDGTLRLCVDYRRLNSVSNIDAYPMPQIDELIDNLGNTVYQHLRFDPRVLAGSCWRQITAEDSLHNPIQFVPVSESPSNFPEDGRHALGLVATLCQYILGRFDFL